jgi:hypothetical protein
MTEISFPNENAFSKWFIKNHKLLGFSRLIKNNKNQYPDFIMERDGNEIRVELETLSSHFIDHGHDPNNVDLVVCIVYNKPLEVPTLEITNAYFIPRWAKHYTPSIPPPIITLPYRGVATLQQNNKITIPSKIAHSLNIEPGDIIGYSIIVTPVGTTG